MGNENILNINNKFNISSKDTTKKFLISPQRKKYKNGILVVSILLIIGLTFTISRVNDNNLKIDATEINNAERIIIVESIGNSFPDFMTPVYKNDPILEKLNIQENRDKIIAQSTSELFSEAKTISIKLKNAETEGSFNFVIYSDSAYSWNSKEIIEAIRSNRRTLPIYKVNDSVFKLLKHGDLNLAYHWNVVLQKISESNNSFVLYQGVNRLYQESSIENKIDVKPKLHFINDNDKISTYNLELETSTFNKAYVEDNELIGMETQEGYGCFQIYTFKEGDAKQLIPECGTLMTTSADEKYYAITNQNNDWYRFDKSNFDLEALNYEEKQTPLNILIKGQNGDVLKMENNTNLDIAKLDVNFETLQVRWAEINRESDYFKVNSPISRHDGWMATFASSMGGIKEVNTTYDLLLSDKSLYEVGKLEMANDLTISENNYREIYDEAAKWYFLRHSSRFGLATGGGGTSNPRVQITRFDRENDEKIFILTSMLEQLQYISAADGNSHISHGTKIFRYKNGVLHSESPVKIHKSVPVSVAYGRAEITAINEDASEISFVATGGDGCGGGIQLFKMFLSEYTAQTQTIYEIWRGCIKAGALRQLPPYEYENNKVYFAEDWTANLEHYNTYNNIRDINVVNLETFESEKLYTFSDDLRYVVPVIKGSVDSKLNKDAIKDDDNLYFAVVDDVSEYKSKIYGNSLADDFNEKVNTRKVDLYRFNIKERTLYPYGRVEGEFYWFEI